MVSNIVLVVVAICAITILCVRGINITINHVYEDKTKHEVQPMLQEEDLEQSTKDKQLDVASALQSIYGILNEEGDSNE